jgi:hypothetical protein
MSDHYEGNIIAYAADFGLNTTFGSRKDDATKFAIAVAKNAGANVSSWEPFKGNSFKYNTPDGYRVQVIWLSNVGGNHYDHVHVGVKKGAGAATYRGQEDAAQDADSENKQQSTEQPPNSTLSDITDMLKGGFTKEKGLEKLQGILGNTISDIGKAVGKKLF